MTDSSQRIESATQSFVAEFSQLVRRAALEVVEAALVGGASPSRRGPGRPKGSRNKAEAMPARAARGGKSGHRPTEGVNALASSFLAYVKANDGKRLEEIAAALKVPSQSLKRPAQKLLAAKAVKTTGQKRGTKYHVGSGAGQTLLLLLLTLKQLL